MKAPEEVGTDRLLLRRPREADAHEIFRRYASDAEVTRYVGFRAHVSIDDARSFIEMSNAEWDRWGAGPYLLRLRSDASLIGGTGLHLETPLRAMTGYVLARDSWGKGYATETVKAIIEIARAKRIQRLYAICHTEHAASVHVLEKCGLIREGILRSYMEFPNLSPGHASDVYCYALVL